MKLFNVKDFFIIGITAVVFIFLMNWAFTRIGLERFRVGAVS